MAGAKGFTTEVLDFEEIHTLIGTWSADRHRALLEWLDFEGADALPEAELSDMAAMAAQDLGIREASDRVLEFVFGERMSAGVRQNLVDDLTDDRPWEQFADLNRQAGIFEAVDLLQRAFPSEFGIPDAARVRVRLTAHGKHEAEWLRAGPPASLLLRLLASAMDERATLRRLYGEQLAGSAFPEADSIVWATVVVDEEDGASTHRRDLDVYSSLQWLGPLRESEGVHASDPEPDGTR